MTFTITKNITGTLASACVALPILLVVATSVLPHNPACSQSEPLFYFASALLFVWIATSIGLGALTLWILSATTR